jgi:NDP-sugar pyrophosphorylase family protein
MIRDASHARREAKAAHGSGAPEPRASARAVCPEPRDAEATVSAIVLAGAQSWGECPLERVLPRPLSLIVNRPLISHVLEWLDRSGIRKACICGSSYTQILRKNMTNGNRGEVPDGMTVDYYHDIAPRGPAGCVRDAGFNGKFDICVAVEGTIVPQADLGELIDAHRRSGAALTVVVSGDCHNGDPANETLTPTGIYLFSRSALEHVPAAGYQDIKEALIPRLYQCGKSVLTYRTEAPAPRVTGVDSYLAVSEWALAHFLERADHFVDYRKLGDARVHPTASVSSTSRLIGPILIGPGSIIKGGGAIVGPTTIGANSMVKEGAVICRTSVWDDAVVGAGAVLDRCVVTSRANVGGESSYRYMVLSEFRPRFPRIGRWFDR